MGTIASRSPKYRDVARALRRKVLSGEWSVGERIPPERDLERQFGVSRPTVGKALSELVHEGLLQRYQGRGTFVGEITEHATQPVRFVYYLGTDHLMMVGHQALLHRVETSLREAEIPMLFSRLTTPDADGYEGVCDEGGIIAVGEIGDAFLSRQRAKGIPVVLIDRETPGVDVVAIDNQAVAQAGFQALSARGHRRIAFIGNRQTDTQQWANSQARQDGMLQAARACGISVPDAYLQAAWDGKEASAQLTSMSPAPTACIFSSLAVAQDALEQPDTPTGLTVIAFGDGSVPRPSPGHTLLVADIDWTDMGLLAIDFLLARIKNSALPRRKVLVQAPFREVTQ